MGGFPTSGGATAGDLAALIANQTNGEQLTQIRDSAGNEIGTIGHPIVVTSTSSQLPAALTGTQQRGAYYA